MGYIERAKNIMEDLTEFVKRVSRDEDATPAELAALPGVAEVLLKANFDLVKLC